MIKKILIGIFLLIMVVGCNYNNGLINIPATTHNSPTIEGVCGYDVTQVFFRNNDTFVEYKDFIMKIETDGIMHFQPDTELKLCNEVDEERAICKTVNVVIKLPCTKCVVITSNYTIIDNGNSCLTGWY